MVMCSAPNCNVTRKMGYRLYYFPADPKLRKAWIDKMEEGFWAMKSSKICERHFTEDCFMLNPVMARSVGFSRVALNKDAIPTKFDSPPTKNSPSIERKQTSGNIKRPENPGMASVKKPRRIHETCALQTESLTEDNPEKSELTKSSATVSTANSLIENDTLSRPSPAKIQKKTERRFKDPLPEKRRQMSPSLTKLRAIRPRPLCIPMQITALPLALAPAPAPAQSDPRRKKLLTSPVNVTVVKSEPEEQPQPCEKDPGEEKVLQPPVKVTVVNSKPFEQPSQPCEKNPRQEKLFTSPVNLAMVKSEPEEQPQPCEKDLGEEKVLPTPVKVLVVKAKPVEQPWPHEKDLSQEKVLPPLVKVAVVKSKTVEQSQLHKKDPKQEKVLSYPIHVKLVKSKSIEQPQPHEKQILAVANYQNAVMSSLASLWKNEKLCDARISNGSATVLVHKVILASVCPKLLSAFSDNMFSQKFMQVNFPEKVSERALKAFAEYMYKGLLNLDPEILEQLKIIANKLDMVEFEALCDCHLPDLHMHQPMHQPISTAATVTNVPSIQTTIQSTREITPEIIHVKQEISNDNPAKILSHKELDVVPPAPIESGDTAGSVTRPIVKIEQVGPEDGKYGHWNGTSCQKTSTSSSMTSSSIASTTSTSNTSMETSSEEFAIHFSKTANLKSTKLKIPPFEATLVSSMSPASRMVKSVHSQTNHMIERSSKPLSSRPP